MNVQDCPECGAAGSITGNMCEVCYAELDERVAGTTALPPAVPAPFLRLADVLRELRAVADLAAETGPGGAVAEACRRLETLLMALRAQFTIDVAHVAAAAAVGPVD